MILSTRLALLRILDGQRPGQRLNLVESMVVGYHWKTSMNVGALSHTCAFWQILGESWVSGIERKHFAALKRIWGRPYYMLRPASSMCDRTLPNI